MKNLVLPGVIAGQRMEIHQAGDSVEIIIRDEQDMISVTGAEAHTELRGGFYDGIAPHLDTDANNSAGRRAGVASHVYDMLFNLEPDATREGLIDTPKRVAAAWEFWTRGYAQDPAAILKVFEDGAANYDEMVSVVDIPIYSKCEHHLADIFGTCTISYIPDGKIVGLSKLSRLADCFARRLQVQERLTTQIADAINEHLSPKGVGVHIKARHMCMESRGLCQQGHHTVTTALRGVIKTDPSARAEFLALTR